jgi:hypothetical protein
MIFSAIPFPLWPTEPPLIQVVKMRRHDGLVSLLVRVSTRSEIIPRAPLFKEDARQSTALVQPTCYSNVAHRDHQSYRSPRLGARQRSFSTTSQWCRACFAFVGFFIVGIEVEIMNLCQIRTVWISKEPR